MFSGNPRPINDVSGFFHKYFKCVSYLRILATLDCLLITILLTVVNSLKVLVVVKRYRLRQIKTSCEVVLLCTLYGVSGIWESLHYTARELLFITRLALLAHEYMLQCILICRITIERFLNTFYLLI